MPERTEAGAPEAAPAPNAVLVANALFLVCSVRVNWDAGDRVTLQTTRVVRNAIMRVDDATGHSARLTLWNGTELWVASSARQIEKLLVDAHVKYDRGTWSTGAPS